MTAPGICLPGQANFYLGRSGSIIKLIDPDAYYSGALDNQVVQHALLGGGTHVQHNGRIRRSYTLAYTARVLEQADQIVSIANGQLGPGPYYFIDPMWRNVLPSHVSSAGTKLSSSAGFVASNGGTVAYATPAAAQTQPPASRIPVGAMTWTGAGVNSWLDAGASATGILQTTAPPVTPLLPMTFYCDARTATGTASVRLQALYNDVTGAFITGMTLSTTTVTTTWQTLAGTVAAGGAPANATTVSIRLLNVNAGAPVISATKFGMSYVVAAASGTPPVWVLGLSVPQVSVGDKTPSNQAVQNRRRSHTLTLVEA